MSTSVTIEVVAAIGSVLGAVLIDDAECQRMLEQARLEQRAQRFANLTLKTFDLGRLAQSAREARFGVRETKDWLRIDVPGQRDPVWAARTSTGIAMVGGAETADRVKVANSVSRLTQTLASKGATLARVPSGSRGRNTEFEAVMPDNRRLKIAVTPSGNAVVDAVNHLGPECERVVRDLAAAMEGTITSSRRKPEYFGSAAVEVGRKQRA